ncbi:LuxR C-terminal-related transcriptional regulator [Streptomyces sp. NPDC093089]|uniref:LuxR C-terminal-related transcriptional regulator n=1 Tax=Streptomyces sp. NPDC093089 TaxID=3366024 RepID=UPI00381F49EA
MISVLVVSDESLQRLALRTLIAGDAAMTVIGEVADAAEAVEAGSALRPDVILLDRRFANGDNLRVIGNLVDPARAPFGPASSRHLDAPRRVLVMNVTESDGYALAALRSGVRGLVPASTPTSRLLAAIRTVAAGGAVLPPQCTRILMETVRQHQYMPLASPNEGISLLTVREREVLTAVASGWSNSDIADWFGISTSTVKSHVGKILRKIGLRARVEAVSFAYECGLLRSS